MTAWRKLRRTASPTALWLVLYVIRGVTGILERHVRSMRLAGRSVRTQEQRVMAVRLLERHAGRPAESLAEADLDAWQGSLGLLAPATRRSYVSQVTCYYRWLLAEAAVPADPSGVLVRPRVPRRRPRAFPEAALARALACVPPVVRVWLALAAYAGLRASEIASLRREDILDDLPRPQIRVVGKGDKERTVPLSPGLWKILLDFGLPSRGPLFRRADGSAETGKHVSATANRWLHRLGLRWTIHKARHRFASRSLDNGTRLHVLMEWLGHDSLASTQAYLEPTVTDADAAAVAAIDHPLTGDDR